ncbi:MAG: hypothetical protein PHV07_09385, partial [Oscillospiraceae bacterium]|nr:hypothetical protein [Oscillospiraceae bacterium]
MQILWPLWEIFVNLVETFLFCILLNKKLGYEPEKARRIWVGMFGLTIFLSMINRTNIDYRIITILIMALDILYALWSHSGDRGQRIFWGSSSTVIAFIGNSVILQLFSYTQDTDPNNVMAQTNIRFQLMCLYLLAI